MSKIRQVDSVTEDHIPDLSDIFITGGTRLSDVAKDYHLIFASLPMRQLGSTFINILGAFGAEQNEKLVVRRVMFAKPLVTSTELGDLNKMLLAVPKEYAAKIDEYLDTVAVTDEQRSSLTRFHVSRMTLESDVVVSAINLTIGDKAFQVVPDDGHLTVLEYTEKAKDDDSFLVALRHNYEDPYLFAELKLDENYFSQSNE